jgi:hypothetical protein
MNYWSGNDKKKNPCKVDRYSWGSYLSMYYDVAFTLNVKSMLNENLGGILGGTKCLNGWYHNVKRMLA